ncbi:MAG: transcriptional regulator [Firmicutes bacterium]|nr:transcriptional regulator [Bacillota bacterium]
MNFEPIQKEKMYQNVIQQVKQMIFDGQLKKGDKLPAERNLAAQLGVSRSTIREAFSALELLGILESRHGEGSFVSVEPLRHSSVEPLSLLFMLEEDAQLQLIDVRRMLEAECAFLAAHSAGEEDIGLLRQCIQDFEQNTIDQTFSSTVDRTFHFTIAKASGNVLLYYLYSAISEALKHHIRTMRLRIVNDPDNIEQLLVQHKKIYQYICEQDAQKARQAMLEHMEFVKSYVK